MKLSNDPYAEVTYPEKAALSAVEAKVEDTEAGPLKWVADTLKQVRGVVGVWVSGKKVSEV